MTSGARQQLQEVVAQSRLAWESAFGQAPDKAMLDEQVDAVVRSMQMTKAVSQAAAAFGELLLSTLSRYTSDDIPPEVAEWLKTASAQDLDSLLQAAAWKVVHDVATTDVLPEPEAEVVVVDLDIEVPSLPGTSGESS